MIIFPGWVDTYNNHLVDMDGTIIFTTVREPLIDRPLVGRLIEDILPPGDAVPLMFALFRAVTEQNYQWVSYSLMDHAFVALIEYLDDHQLFSIHEARIENGETKRYKMLLLAASGYYYQTFTEDTG